MAAEKQRRRLRSSTVVLGGMGVLAAALSACGSEPDKRCVDRDSYDLVNGYKIVADKNCKSGGSSYSSGKGRKTGSSYGSGTGTGTGTGTSKSGRMDADWYYDADVSGRYADYGTFSHSEAVDRDGFGCSGSGSGGG
ncbi:hypothetical protein OG453_22395 [Streptomyces sp. NBC_01381]|uniref:hypothetical protein n=1 Tax=Streptomyces sp. NBC_01381 TaxID=2903845 RepID=UPI00225A349E|nr:hypothetical protein [Streptomyces sp. NBC_01381]MCX4669393.1 hypothetical protein [Streptomyces sp. NBC_01381]